jgi:WD40 repeat protein
VLKPSHALNLFNDQQEYELGEIFAQQISFSLHVIEDEAVTGKLKVIGNRLIAQMPRTNVQFRFFVVDSPEANAFSIPGGRIYVTRRLITTVQTEDELAGVIGHEMGHELAHHGALDWSKALHDTLGVTQLGDRADIEDKYNQFLDTYRTKGTLSGVSTEEHEQVGADQVAVYAVARAGYSPQAVADFWDRFSESQGKKGNWFLDAFGNTRPESKRLRQFAKDVQSLPANCIQMAGKQSSPDDFVHWQAAVKNYNGFGKKETLHHILMKRALEPDLRDDIKTFRFSMNGRYLLAQDSGSIFVLSRDPLTFLFRIDAHDALDPHFSPDSRYVVFHSEGLRVERWDVAEQRLEDVREVYVYGGCIQSEFSPDGSYLACLRPDRTTLYPLEFTLYDVNTGIAALTKKAFLGPVSPMQNPYAMGFYFIPRLTFHGTPMAFSPDGRYFVLGSPDKHLLIDLTSRSEMNMSDRLRRATSYTFAFVGSDKVIGADKEDLEQASEVKFPSGELLSEHITLGYRTVYPITNGPYAVVRPMLKAPLGILDIDAKRIFRASHSDATDIFGDAMVSERVNGEVALYHLKEEKPFATVNLPHATFGDVTAGALGSESSAIAISQKHRGAIWNLKTGEQVAAIHGFRGAFFGTDALYLDFAPFDQFKELPARGETEEDVRRREAQKPGDTLARADLTTRSIVPVFSFQKRNRVRQFGSIVLTWTPADDNQPDKEVKLEARDVQTSKVIWSRTFANGGPWVHSNEDREVAIFSWVLGSKAAKEELENDPEAKRVVNVSKGSEGSYFVEVVDLRLGKALCRFVVDTGRGSFVANKFLAATGTVVMIDKSNRIALYSFKGDKKGRSYGGEVALSPDGRKICIEQEPGRLTLFDAERMQKLDEMTFGSRLAYIGFTEDSQQFMVLTADQIAYVFASQSTAPK